jgi:hypothetical protein
LLEKEKQLEGEIREIQRQEELTHADSNGAYNKDKGSDEQPEEV